MLIYDEAARSSRFSFLSDFDQDGDLALTAVLGFFVERSGGLAQADGEGFYEGDRLILELG